MTPDTAPATADTDNPINAFHDCHAGIVKKLAALEDLPGLLQVATQARRLCGELHRFYREAILEHHAEEERELFPAVLASAAPGAERNQVEAIVARLTAEHRELEARFQRLEPALKAGAKGHDADLDKADVWALTSAYLGHARYEEREFLPLSEAILGRNSHHLQALGLSLHMRHALPKVLAQFGHRI